MPSFPPAPETEERMETAHIARTRTRITAIAVSFLVGILLLVMKFYAFRITGSSAILSDALESIINVVAAGFALASVLIHLDPCLEEDCPVCGNTRCRLRVQDLQQEVPWDVRTLTMRGGIHAARDNARGRD